MGNRKLVTIGVIASINIIPGADKIEVASVRGWKVVVQKGMYKVGDKVMFYEPDSFLPMTENYSFLLNSNHPRKMLVDGKDVEGIRLKTIRLRGQISQGLVMPYDGGLEDGTDITELLGVLKYEAPISPSLAGLVRGSFPSVIPKTDEERVQNLGDVIVRHQGEKFYITEKIDGTSATFYKHEGYFGCCSRNLDLKETEGNTHWKIARQLKLEEIIPDGFVLQGEIAGEGIQGNPLKLKGNKLFVFSVYDINNGEFVSLLDCAWLKGLDTVPVVDKEFTLNHSVDELIAMADAPSALNKDAKREGIVIRPLIEQREIIGGSEQRFSFKCISNEYLLKNER